MFHRLCPWQGNKQAPREQSLRGGVEVEGTVLGCGWLRGGDDTGDGRCSKSKRIGVKEMLTDAVNVIYLLPQEVDSSLYCSFVPSTFSSPNIHGLRAWRKLRNCMEAEDAEGPCSQVEKVLYNFK